jgi:hypothetical protein
VLQYHWFLWLKEESHEYERKEAGIIGRTSVHGSQHARDKPINPPAFLDQRNQGRDAAFVVEGATEMGKDQFLKRLDLVL